MSQFQGEAESHNHSITKRKTNQKPTLCLCPTFQMTFQKYSTYAMCYSNFYLHKVRGISVGIDSTKQVLLVKDLSSFLPYFSSFSLNLSLSFSPSYLLFHIYMMSILIHNVRALAFQSGEAEKGKASMIIQWNKCYDSSVDWILLAHVLVG